MKRITFLKDFEPRRLSEVVGCDEIVELMNGWISRDSLPSGILISGDIGVGKSTLANLLATAAACLKRREGSPEPCGECSVCKNYFNSNIQRLIGSQIDARSFAEQLSWMNRSGSNFMCFNEHGRWHPVVIDEFHELPKQTQRDLRVEIDNGWRDSFLIGTSSESDKIDNALRDRMQSIHLLEPSKTPLSKWIIDIWQRAGMKDGDPKAAGLLVDLTNGRFRAVLQVLQRLYDRGGKFNESEVRRACQSCGYGRR